MIILLHGLSRSGKDTVARRLVERFRMTHLKISSHLKRCASLLFDVPLEDFEERQKDDPHPKWGRSPREMLKFLGTDVFQYKIESFIPGRNRCFWIDYLHKDIADELALGRSVVISDYRFEHELISLRTRFPKEALHVLRVVPCYSGFVGPARMDESEECLPFDFEIRNVTIDQLHREVDDLFADLMIRKPTES